MKLDSKFFNNFWGEISSIIGHIQEIHVEHFQILVVQYFGLLGVLLFFLFFSIN